MTKAIIFDFFGVICPDLHQKWIDEHHLENVDVFYDDLAQKVDLGAITENDFIQSLSERSKIPAEQITRDVNDEIVIDQDIIDLIRGLKSKYKIGLLSDASAPFLKRILADHNLDQYFDVVGISSEIGHTKPSPESFFFMLNALKVDPDEVVFIDDHSSNIRGAEKIGMRGLLYKNYDSLKKSLENL